MKKIIALSLVSIVSLFLVGCKKEKEEFSLVGKTYAGFSHNAITFDVYKSWRFISDTEIEETSRNNAPDGHIIGNPRLGTYILNYPKLIVKVNNSNDIERTYECEFINETCFRASLFQDEITEFTQQ